MRVKSEERRQAILDTAKLEFAKNGFSQTSMATIAKKVGGSKATLYNYFSSKEEIFTAMMDAVTEKLASTFHHLSAEKDIKLNLTRFGCSYLTYLCTPELMTVNKVAYAEAGLSNLGLYYYENGPKKGWKIIEILLKEYIENGVLKTCDTWIAAMQLKALLEAELRDPYALGIIEPPTKEMIDAVTERAIDSFLCLYAMEN